MSSFSRASAQNSIFAIRAVVEVPQQSFTYRQGQLSVDQRPQSRADNRTLGIDRRSFGRSFISSVSDDAAIGRLYFSQAKQCNRRRRKKLPTDCRFDPLSFRKLKSERLFGYLARRSGNRAPPHGAPGEESAREFVQAVDARGWRRQKRPR